MKVVIAVLMTVFLSLGTANSLFAKDGKGAEGKRKMPEEMLKKFDKDGDGKLSEEEKAAAKAAIDEKRPELKANMLEKFDKDKDGKLSDEEKAEMKKAMEERRAEMKKKMLEKFDKDKDGKLSDEEKAEMKKAMEQHREKNKGDGKAKAGDQV